MSTGIQWTQKTWNPVIGCTPVSPGCLNCYAATMANRLRSMPKAKDYHDRRIDSDGRDVTGLAGLESEHDKIVRIAEVRGGRAVFTGDVRCLPERLEDPLRWKKPRTIFVNSMSDLFHEAVPFEFVDRVFAVMALCPQHTFQVLTKRPERMAEYVCSDRVKCVVMRANGAEIACPVKRKQIFSKVSYPLPNVWLGTSVENQAAANERIPHLLRCPAAVRFLSVEPLLGPVDLTNIRESGIITDAISGVYWAEANGNKLTIDPIGITNEQIISWVIVGGESGANARPCNVEWIRSLVQQCKAASVPVFVKQLGAKPTHHAGIVAEVEAGRAMATRDAVARDAEGLTPLYLSDPKGGNPSEWPVDMRDMREMREMREMPTVKVGVA